ncbi:MAG: aminoacetone oxidase family FAD-binding enzyme [Clostridia bacterium]|nr:aminoacetone oxidase family FAD-binding enzyme [Clostridia bacterium]
MKHYKVIIIGAGASGVMCALQTKQKDIAIIDKNTKPLKKVLVTGNGRCNLTNLNLTSKNYNQNIDKFLLKFNEKNTLKFFEEIGLETFADEENRVYPISNSSKSVTDVLMQKLNNKADLILGQSVEDVEKTQDGFVVKTDIESFSCEKLVVSTGGNSVENIFKNLNIKYKNFYPSLVALKSKDVKDLNGVKVSNVLVSATNNKGETKKEKGEVLFKDGGLSGIVIFNLSSIFARNCNFKGLIQIDLLPDLSRNQLVEKLEKRKSLNVNLDKFFVGMFQNSIANEIFKQTKINTNINSQKLNSEQISLLVNTIKNLKFEVYDYFDNNQIHSGGVSLSSLDENLMSKQINNLYFTGEVCDVDGDCGGFNLQWAWTSGFIVGDNL